VIALSELIVHGWGIAVTSVQRLGWDGHLLEAAHRFVQATITQNVQGTSGCSDRRCRCRCPMACRCSA